MRQDSESNGTTFLRSLKHRLRFHYRYRTKEDIMGNKVYDLDFALRSLVLHETVTHYALNEGDYWIPSKQGCVPSQTHSFKTSTGRYWNSATGWGELVQPEDRRHPINSEQAYFRIPAAALDALTVEERKEFHRIRDKLDKIAAKDREFNKFFCSVAELIPAFNLRVTYNKDELPRSEVDDRLRRILRSAYYGE